MRPVVSRSQAGLGRGLPWQGVDNCLATLAGLRPGRVMSIGTVEAGGARFGIRDGGKGVCRCGRRKNGGWPRVWRRDGCGFLVGVQGGQVRFLGSGLWAGEGRGAGHAARWARAGRSFDLDVRQVVCALALEWRGFAFGSEGRRQRGSSGRGG